MVSLAVLNASGIACCFIFLNTSTQDPLYFSKGLNDKLNGNLRRCPQPCDQLLPGQEVGLQNLNAFDCSSEGFGFIGRISFDCEVQHDLIKGADSVNMGNQIVKIIFFSVNQGQMVQFEDKDLLISIRILDSRAKIEKQEFRKETTTRSSNKWAWFGTSKTRDYLAKFHSHKVKIGKGRYGLQIV